MSSDRLNNRPYQRNIYKRIIVKGMLVLDTPTCLGSGDSDSLTDLALLRDSVDEDKALLTGASIAGALRNYLHEYNPELGLAKLLFGGERGDDQGDQSPLIVNDSVSNEKIDIELRDGVKIDGKTGTAMSKAKYDFELLSAGTEFPLFFELLIEEGKDENQLKQELAITLSGFENGEIAIGMKKRRGFGRCHVENWQVWEFDLKDNRQRLEWLNFEHWNRNLSESRTKISPISIVLGAIPNDNKRDRFTITAKFSLIGSMLIRSGQSLQKAEDGKYKKSPDDVHLKSYRPTDKNPIPVISGTSLAGVLRHRSVRIINTLEKDLQIVDDIFGTDISDNGNKEAKASRLIVHESEIKESSELVQSRIAIDRFTGGAMHGALFDAQPVFSGEVELKLELRNPKEHEIGLLLLLLKDLWTGDLPIGGESSIGRGRLQGIHADICHQEKCHQEKKWTIHGKDSLKIIQNGAQESLESYVQKLVNKVE
ncbi:MAG: RAMP superfamily CRISPR-associated protein [Pseudanabaena sp.]|jgi:CRISPR/Cas system CSM-associated protein Csm3 (group 7 of RAMP superfamily)